MLPSELPPAFADYANTAAFTGMQLLEPLFSYGTTSDPGNTEAVHAIGVEHGKKLIAVLETLQQG